MDFIDHLRVLATRISSTRSLISTEEAIKNAMVMPFIQILGYIEFMQNRIKFSHIKT